MCVCVHNRIASNLQPPWPPLTHTHTHTHPCSNANCTTAAGSIKPYINQSSARTNCFHYRQSVHIPPPPLAATEHMANVPRPSPPTPPQSTHTLHYSAKINGTHSQRRQRRGGRRSLMEVEIGALNTELSIGRMTGTEPAQEESVALRLRMHHSHHARAHTHTHILCT